MTRVENKQYCGDKIDPFYVSTHRTSRENKKETSVQTIIVLQSESSRKKICEILTLQKISNLN